MRPCCSGMVVLCLSPSLIHMWSISRLFVEAAVDFTPEEAARTVAVRMKDPEFAHLKSAPMDPSGEHPLKKLGPKSLACSGCKLFADKFQFKIARKIKGHMLASEKEAKFKKYLTQVCKASAFPKDMAILKDDQEGHIFIDYEDKDRRGGGILSLTAVGPEVTLDVVKACRHLIESEFRDALLRRFVSSSEDGRDIDVLRLLCGAKGAAVCDLEEDEEDQQVEEYEEL
eukprot:TRINITY_DN65604_c0_g1_i1.p1 TRINITY_DN65604_c0_g1~~TRINITY_DN65604_c0_g1_i1.p1  ORF type:complete len:228 (-),score=41.51 TRINITY_DN65604_c0_g1_i1:146-829(-)